jgi:hypothetical protein
VSEQWRERGRIERCSVTHVLLSPGYDEDRRLVAVTPAGLAVSRDAGETWETPARGIVGPFIRDLIWTTSPGAADVLLASTPGGLWRSLDGGRTWHAVVSSIATGPLLALGDVVVLLASEIDGTVWRIRLDDPTPQPVGRLPGAALALAGPDEDGAVWAATIAGVFVSRDQGATWHLIWHEDGQLAQTVATFGGDTVVVGTASDGVRVRLNHPLRWESFSALWGQAVAALTTSPDGALMAAGGSAGVFVSSDGGASWAGPRLDRPALSLAVSRDGSQIWAGLVSGGCARSSDRCETWESVPVPDGTVVVDVRTSGELIVARTAEGFVSTSSDGGVTWRSGPLPDQIRVQAVAIPSAPNSPIYATDVGLVSESDGESRSLHGGVFAHLATCEGAPDLVVAATDREVLRSSDHGHTWDSLAPPLDQGETIVDLALGDPPGGEPGGLIAVATLAAGGQGAVWLHSGAAWRRAIVHPKPAPTVRLAAIPGPRGLFAAIGDSVYRLTRLGAALFARDDVVAGKSAQVLQIAVVRGKDDVVLAALTTTGLSLSRDGGITWEELSGPLGPPVTALTLRQSEGHVELIAVLLGGRVRAFTVGRSRFA